MKLTSEKYDPSHIPTVHTSYNSLFYNFRDACKNAIFISIGIWQPHVTLIRRQALVREDNCWHQEM